MTKRKVRTSIQPGEELEVDQAELSRLHELGLIVTTPRDAGPARLLEASGSSAELAVRAAAPMQAGALGLGATHDIQTTMRPDQTITVGDAEYQQLLAEGLVYSGSPQSPAADSYDLLFADKVQHGTATPAALRAAFVPKWKPSTAYTAGDIVMSPSGQIVQAKATFTAGASFLLANWTVVAGGASASPAGRRRVSASPASMYPANTAGFVMSASNTTLQARLWQRTPKAGRNVSVEFLTVQGPAETALGGDQSNITVRVAAEYPAGTFYPAYDRSGNRDIAVTPSGGIGRLWIPGFEVPAGQDWWLRLRAMTTVTGALPYTVRPNIATEWASGPNAATTDLTVTNTGAPANGTGNPGVSTAPSLVSYEPYDQTTPCVLVIGDSIMQGHGDDGQSTAWFTSNPGGWAIRALSADGSTGRSLPGVSNVQLSCSSEKAQNWLGRSGKSRMQLVDDVDATTAWVGFTNDITSTITQLKSDFLTLWTMLANRGLRVVAFTIPPRSTSTDSWATTANQTPNIVVRNPANQWLRAGAPIDPTTKVAVAVGTSGALVAGQVGHPVAQVVDICPAVETAQDSGIWQANGTANYMTADGTHPTAVGHAALATIAYAQAVPTIV